MKAAFDWKEFSRFLLPVFIFFFLVLRPLILRRNRKPKRESPMSGPKPGTETGRLSVPETIPEEPPLIPSADGPTTVTRLVEDLDESVNPSAMNTAEVKPEPAADRIRLLGDLQQRILWAEILGPPGGLASRKNREEY